MLFSLDNQEIAKESPREAEDWNMASHKSSRTTTIVGLEALDRRRGCRNIRYQKDWTALFFILIVLEIEIHEEHTKIMD